MGVDGFLEGPTSSASCSPHKWNPQKAALFKPCRGTTPCPGNHAVVMYPFHIFAGTHLKGSSMDLWRNREKLSVCPSPHLGTLSRQIGSDPCPVPEKFMIPALLSSKISTALHQQPRRGRDHKIKTTMDSNGFQKGFGCGKPWLP